MARLALSQSVHLTWQKRNDPLLRILLASFHGELVQHLHLNREGRRAKTFHNIKYTLSDILKG